MTSEYVGVVDALPYFDKGYDDPGIREAAALLVEEEMKRYRPTKNYLEHLPSLSGPVQPKFETDMMKAEYDRLANRLPMELLSMKRYELPPPPAGKMTDVKAWQDAMENAEAQLEHQATRIKNLELMAEYGCNAWKQFNDILENDLRIHEKRLLEIRRQIQDINWQRKQEQTTAGTRLKELEETWVGLVGKNYEIEQAILDLERDLGLESAATTLDH
ncbi:Pre-mRNA-splicing factor SPF27 [Clonorchis sinensis]|uniref:Pre-mRNA-splicing factor SPF27 n=2 Tax=Clonorchis sinensis TaxID=79923 RepID=A0A8T1MGE7_CLOSI|nr:Pre-mRNA-splicing factor SPF27 [Clonorchis sinensis]GAA29370.1 pre-mRNA-splicing factor SPF27 [Clonorchis sinensis]